MDMTVGREDRADGRCPPTGLELRRTSALLEAHVAGTWALARFLGRKLYALALAKQLEHGAADGTAVKEVLDSAFIADETEALIDQKASDRAGRHTRVLSMNRPPGSSREVDKLGAGDGPGGRGPKQQGCADDLPISRASSGAITLAAR